MNPKSNKYLRSLELAFDSLKNGDKYSARIFAEKAIKENPNSEDAWLILAALSSPKASVYYAKKSLDINPSSVRARKAIEWALHRQRKSQTLKSKRLIVNHYIPSTAYRKKRRFLAPYGTLIIAIFSIFYLWLSNPGVTFADEEYNSLQSINNNSAKATFTSTPTPTFTPTPTPTNTLTPSPTPTNTPTLIPTATYPPTPIPTWTQEPSNDPIKPPADITSGKRWIDINLSKQTLYAYQGKNLIGSFIVSTGVWQYPTLVGQYHIYVKYRYADMTGPGYYLPDVPYVMYYYKGYGIHGTYWHHNFGTPMSHGCINMITEEAGWLFNWAPLGTLVNIHY